MWARLHGLGCIAALDAAPMSGDHPDMTHPVQTLEDATLDAEVARTGPPLLVNFWDPGNALSHGQEPLVDDVAAAYLGRMRVAQVDISAHPGTMARHQVKALPTLVLFKQGKAVETVVGLVSRSKLDEILARHVDRAPAR